MLTVLLVPVGENPRVVEIPHTFKEMRKLIGGGSLEGKFLRRESIAFWWDEEFLYKPEMKPNRNTPWGLIHGPMFLSRVNQAGDTLSLEPGDVEAWRRIFCFHSSLSMDTCTDCGASFPINPRRNGGRP